MPIEFLKFYIYFKADFNRDMLLMAAEKLLFLVINTERFQMVYLNIMKELIRVNFSFELLILETQMIIN